MKQLYKIATDETMDLQTRYDAVRIMQCVKNTKPRTYFRVRNRDYKAEYKKRMEDLV